MITRKDLPLLLMILLSVVLFIGNWTMTNTTDITNLICILTFPFLSVNGLAAMLCFLIPINSGITTLYIFPYILFLIALKRLRATGSKVAINSTVVLVIVLCFYELIMGIVIGQLDWMEYALYVTVVIVMFYFMNKKDLDFQKCCIAFAAGTSLLLIYVLLLAVRSGQSLSILGSDYNNRIGMAFKIKENTALLSDNANNLGYYSIVSISMLLLLLRRATLREKVWFLLLLATNLFGGIFTVSRTWLVLLLVTVALTLVFGYDVKGKIGLTILILAIGYYLFDFLAESTSVIDGMLERFNMVNLKDNDRIQLMEEYFSFLREHPIRYITGTGTLSYKEICKCSNSIHNGTQQLLVCYGIFGMLWYIVELIRPIRKFARMGRLRFYKLIPFVIACLFVQLIQLVNPSVLMLPIMVAVLFMKIPEATRE